MSCAPFSLSNYRNCKRSAKFLIPYSFFTAYPTLGCRGAGAYMYLISFLVMLNINPLILLLHFISEFQKAKYAFEKIRRS